MIKALESLLKNFLSFLQKRNGLKEPQSVLKHADKADVVKASVCGTDNSGSIPDVSTTKTNSAYKRELQVINSDRIDLIKSANQLIGSIIYKQVMPVFSSYPMDNSLELSNEEKNAYNNALAFMSRQFNQGFKETETVEIKVEKNGTV